MLWGDLELSTTADGVQYLAFTERATKTRKGVDTDPRTYVPKIFEQLGTHFILIFTTVKFIIYIKIFHF